jgi:hypothetical protein
MADIPAPARILICCEIIVGCRPKIVDLFSNRSQIVGFTYDMSVNLLYLPIPLFWPLGITSRLTASEREHKFSGIKRKNYKIPLSELKL